MYTWAAVCFQIAANYSDFTLSHSLTNKQTHTHSTCVQFLEYVCAIYYPIYIQKTCNGMKSLITSVFYTAL